MRCLTSATLAVLAQSLVPDLASACAVCLASGWGDRGFTWAFVGLMLAPFTVVAAIAGMLAGARRQR